MSRAPSYTPGWDGYVVAVLVSMGLTILALAASILSEGLGQALAALLVGTIYVTLFAFPTAPVGVLLVHLACRGVRAQWVHVLAAGLAGLLTGLAFQQLVVERGSGPLEGWFLTLLLGSATAAGRAAVIPLVPAVRARRRSSKELVDDDFARTPPGW
ncbi:hypothetical protein [Marmoricola sp. URHB0036]|uniref:hypothetical protein n=1 Tax=Marmoricola sp. URHB0036 TaxID=1298863 RepID=UPI000426B4E0|nr:hypothetical protein [Marmoricola sp. URHB0036]